MRAFGFIFLIFKAFSQRSVAGLSLKTLELYAFVFLFRLSSILRYQGYLPYDRSGDWLYSFLEITALGLCCGVIYLVTTRFNSTYELRYDTFGWLHVPTELGALYILVPCILLGMVSMHQGLIDGQMSEWMLILTMRLSQIIHPNLNRNWFADVAWTIALYIEVFLLLLLLCGSSELTMARGLGYDRLWQSFRSSSCSRSGYVPRCSFFSPPCTSMLKPRFLMITGRRCCRVVHLALCVRPCVW